ncbi:MAG: protoporphyrinogen oxidase, partial [Anaerolineales bacterium]|nr:protoporphyrinogen oxidase [Anaerolineales bacterium]
MQQKKEIIVIGGGISGLSAAWELQQQAGPGLHLTVLEADDGWGGKIATRQIELPGGVAIIDGGPESFVTRKPEVWELAHELGLGEQLVDPGSETSHMFVLEGGKPVAVPLSPLAFVRTPLLSWRGKLRLLGEPFVPARRDLCDESLAAFASRRLGTEAMEKFIGPILAGIYNTDPHTQSILTTSPIMREMEAEYGGLFKAVIGRMRAARRKDGQGPKIPRFVAFRSGAQELVDALVANLQADLRLSAPATALERSNGRL